MKSVTKLVTGWLKTTKVAVFVVKEKSFFLLNIKNMGLCLYIYAVVSKASFFGGQFDRVGKNM